MNFGARLKNVISATLGDSVGVTDGVHELKAQLVDANSRLDALRRQLEATSLSHEETAYLERYRLERRMLANWPGRERDELVKRIRRLLAKLRPMRAVGQTKARFGSANDGGYILHDDFQNVDTVLSFGIEHNAQFDLQMAERGMTVRQYDHTIEMPPTEHRSIFWEKKKISPNLADGCETLSNIIKRFDKGHSFPNMILKIDIEHDEWPVFDATPERDLHRLAQISGEFHGFDFLADRQRLEVVERVFEKLSRNFAVIHIHANNYCDVTNIFGITIPYVLEITFVNRAIYELEDCIELFPGVLDAACNPTQPDIFLGDFRY